LEEFFRTGGPGLVIREEAGFFVDQSPEVEEVWCVRNCAY